MKKVLLLCCFIFIIGCNNQSKNESVMKEYAIQFYNAHQKGQEGLTNPTISIKQLKEAIDKVGDSYVLEKLKNCSDDSYVDFIIDENTGDVKEVQYYLQCD